MNRFDNDTLQLIATRTEQCEKCGLYESCKSPFMLPDVVQGTVSGRVMFVGEAPGADEDDEGTPFVGYSGRTLREAIDESGLMHYDQVYTNVCRCRPPENKTPTKRQAGYCKPMLMLEIERYNPDLIILLGNVPLDAVLGESGITKWRGTLIEDDDRAYLPIFHPAYVLRRRSELMQWIEDFEVAFDYMEGTLGNTDVSDEYSVGVVRTEYQALEMFADIVAAGKCSWDTELSGLNPYDGERLIMMSFAVDTPEKKAWAVVANSDTLPTCDVLLQSDAIEKIGHNIKFDQLAIMALRGYWVQGIVGDSMLMSYILDPMPGRHGLKPLAGRHLGMYDYDQELSKYTQDHPEADPSDGGDFALVPGEILSQYAAKDAIATLELHNLLSEELTDAMRSLYQDLIIPASDALAVMESSGVLVDQEIVSEYTQAYVEERDRMEHKVASYPETQRYIARRKEFDEKYEFNPNSSYQIGDVLYGAIMCPKCGRTMTWHDAIRDSADDTGTFYARCDSCDEIRAFDKAYVDAHRFCGIVPPALTATGRPSVRWDSIKHIELDIMQPYRIYKLMRKMLSTYLEPAADEWIDADGRARSSYLLHGTRTGRLASRAPNLQNIPTPEKEPGTILENLPIKNIFTHSFEGGCLMPVDYSGMELRTMASVARCGGMIEVFERGDDLHSIVTEQLYRVRQSDFNEHDWKALRYKGKWVNWTLLYGGGWYTLNRIYGVPEQEAKELVDRYYDLFPEILEYKERTLQFVREAGYVTSPFGRRRELPYINDQDPGYRSRAERAALNMPIQSSASDMLLCALVVIVDAMRDNGLKSLIVNTVHDSIMFDVYPGELDDLAWLCVEVMENMPTVYGPEWFPNLDFSWFTVPLLADVEVGSHYGSVKPYEGFR